jgi:hypothetical protein
VSTLSFPRRTRAVCPLCQSSDIHSLPVRLVGGETKHGTNHSASKFAEVVFKLYKLQLFSRVGFSHLAIVQTFPRYLHGSCKTFVQVDHRASFILDPTVSPKVNLLGICTEARCVFLGLFAALFSSALKVVAHSGLLSRIDIRVVFSSLFAISKDGRSRQDESENLELVSDYERCQGEPAPHNRMGCH